MHLLLAQKGTLAEADEPIDLGQSAGDIIFLSAADTELAALSMARANAEAAGVILPSLRLVNLANLAHPMSVDLYAAKTLPKAKLAIAKLIGGEAYWRYGTQIFSQAAAEYGFQLCFLSGDGNADDNLLRQSSPAEADCAALGQYLHYGGAENALNFLFYCRYLLGEGEKPPLPRLLPPAGFWLSPEITGAADEAALLQAARLSGKPPVYIIFYRAYAQSGRTEPIEALAKALSARGMLPIPVYVSGLKDKYSAAVLERLFAEAPPALALNATGFAAGAPENSGRQTRTILDKYGNIVLQFILSSQTEEAWRKDGRGLAARDVAMQVSLPEMDGRVLSRAIAFKTAAFYDEAAQCTITATQSLADRVEFVADLAKNWLKLRHKPAGERRIALIIANYPGGDGRLGHGVGLDTPQSLIIVMREMKKAGYDIDNIPQNGNALMHLLAKGVTHEGAAGRKINITLPQAAYEIYFAALPRQIRQAIIARWGAAADDKFCIDTGGGKVFALPIMMFGGIAVALQPERAYGLDPRAVYHDPDIAPSHHYLAFYFWLRHIYRADAVVHMGKHGNLEWLPGKALALSAECCPEIALGAMPHIYPFIVNDPGEGTQAKRRSQAVIIDHMTPPLTRAETYGSLRDLEALIDEYYTAAQMDVRRLDSLKAQIHELALQAGLHEDAGIKAGDDDEQALKKLDAFLCELKELQIRDGLHIFGQAPEGDQLAGLIAALARMKRHEDASGSGLQAAIARDLELAFDPAMLAPQDLAKPWKEIKPALLRNITAAPWRNYGDAVERIELLAVKLIKDCLLESKTACPQELPETEAVLAEIEKEILPYVTSCGRDELKGLLNALDGHFTPPGASGAPTRGRLNVFPMGRNFYALDNRAAPTQTAWELGRKSAELLVRRYAQDNGEWPVSFGITVWGTANMRTGGDDIAQVLALIGAKPVWDGMSRRVTGYEIIPIAKLGRPRVDVLLRISGLFRDAFPEQLILLGEAIRAVGRLDENEADNPIAARIKRDKAMLLAQGEKEKAAETQAQYRIFGAKPGHYGTGVQELIDSGAWETREDLGRVWTEFSAHAYGVHGDCDIAPSSEAEAQLGVKAMLEKRLEAIDAVVQNQDNREHDILDSGEYYAFEGGMAAAAESRQGKKLAVYHNDYSRPERPLIKTLDEELALTLRGRMVNPKWLASAVRHGYKGAAEMAAAVDYLFAFAATAGAVKDAHFDAVYEAYFKDEAIRRFLAEINPAALRDMARRLSEALRRNLWKPKSNSAAADLANLAGGNTGDRDGAE